MTETSRQLPSFTSANSLQGRNQIQMQCVASMHHVVIELHRFCMSRCAGMLA